MISCGARLAVFDIAELREVTSYDELELDTLGDRKTALFLIMSDTDDSFNFLISMCYTQLFNLLCEKADDVYGGRLPVHVRCLIDECANIWQIPKLEKLRAADSDMDETAVPVDLVTCSGSGLDPYISPAAAEYQVARIAKANDMTDDEVRKIIRKCTDGRFLGIFGEETVNVLEVNLMLDGILEG